MGRNKKIKKSILVILALLTAGILTACSSEGNDISETSETDNTETENVEAENDTANKVEVDFWHYMSVDKPEGIYLNEIIDEFNESQDNVFINAQYLPREELMKQYTIGVVSGELPDMGMADNPDHASFASMGVFEDITDLYNEWDDADFLEGPLSSCYYDDKLYGLPWTSNCLGLFYNVDMLKEAGVEVPTTWSELEEASKILTTDTVKLMAISAIGNEEGTFQYMPWLLSAGGDVNKLGSDESKESMAFLKNMMDNGYISNEVVTWNQADAEKQFASGQAAMMINGPWQISGIANDAPDLNYSIAKVPMADNGEHASVLGGENLAICTGGEVDASWEFITWLLNEENSPVFSKEMGYFSPRADVDNETLYADEELNGLFAEILPTAKSRGPSPYWPEISAAIYTAEQEVLTGQKDVDTAMNEAQVTVDEINAR